MVTTRSLMDLFLGKHNDKLTIDDAIFFTFAFESEIKAWQIAYIIIQITCTSMVRDVVCTACTGISLYADMVRL